MGPGGLASREFLEQRYTESDEESGAETEHPVGRPNWRGGQRESRVLGECTHPPRTKPQQSSCRGGQTKLETQQASHEGYEAGHSGRGGMEGPGEEEGEGRGEKRRRRKRRRRMKGIPWRYEFEYHPHISDM